jgi:hypothetical protein
MTALFALVLALACPAAAAPAGRPPRPAPLFGMKGGMAVLPGWDDRALSSPHELHSVGPADFEKPAHVYSDRLIFESGSVTTKPFPMPDTATTLSVVARGVPESRIFPRLRVSVVADGMSTATVYEGYLQSVGMARIPCPVPPQARGRESRVLIEFLNPSALNAHREVWLARLAVE